MHGTRSHRLRLTSIATTAALALAGFAAAGNATLTVESIGAAPGETVRVPIRLSTDDLVGAFDFAVDASGLLVADVAYTGLLFSSGWEGWDTAPAVAAQVTAACIFPEDQVTGPDIPLLELLVEVPTSAKPSSEIAVDLAGVFVSDYSGVPYDVTVNAGTIVVVSAGCAEDIDDDGWVGFGDLLTVIAGWGPCTCAADVDDDGSVGLSDLLMVLARWGACGG